MESLSSYSIPYSPPSLCSYRLHVIALRKVLREQRDAASSLQAKDAGLATSTMQTLSTIASIKGNGIEQMAFGQVEWLLC